MGRKIGRGKGADDSVGDSTVLLEKGGKLTGSAVQPV